MNSATQFSTLKIAALIVAGGNGLRMGGTLPKQYLDLKGQSVLSHTLKVIHSIDIIQTVMCVINDQHESLYQQAVQNNNPHYYCYGGETRQESVYKGLMALKKHEPDIVLIHDAARPCVTPSDIHNLINSLQKHRAAALALPVTESIQRYGQVIDRDNLWILQTPQAFYYHDILSAHTHTYGDFTDDTALYTSWSGQPVHYEPCGRHNIKITTAEDLLMAEKLLPPHHSTETITGFGFDVHAFDDAHSSSVRLGGIDIPNNKSLKGHSDADVVLHAITDAVLGALAEGDIGSHFPPSDDKYKDMDSHVFLNEVLQILRERNGNLRHLDVTIMCEEPKIGPYRGQMRTHLSETMNIPMKRISIKATTTEKLGFTGRGEGIACHALATIQVPSDD